MKVLEAQNPAYLTIIRETGELLAHYKARYQHYKDHYTAELDTTKALSSQALDHVKQIRELSVQLQICRYRIKHLESQARFNYPPPRRLPQGSPTLPRRPLSESTVYPRLVQWTCQCCTLDNTAMSLSELHVNHCSACATSRPFPPSLLRNDASLIQCDCGEKDCADLPPQLRPTISSKSLSGKPSAPIPIPSVKLEQQSWTHPCLQTILSKPVPVCADQLQDQHKPCPRVKKFKIPVHPVSLYNVTDLPQLPACPPTPVTDTKTHPLALPFIRTFDSPQNVAARKLQDQALDTPAAQGEASTPSETTALEVTPADSHPSTDALGVAPHSGDISHFLKIPGRVAILNMSTTNGNGTVIFDRPASPLMYTTQNSANKYTTNLLHFGLRSHFWRGDMHLDIETLATRFHQASLYVVFVPGSFSGSTGYVRPTLDQARNLGGVVIDLGSIDNKTRFTIPFNSTTDYKQTYTMTDSTTPVFDNFSSEHCCGRVVVYVLNPLRVATNDVNTAIDINVDLSAGDNFQYAYPVPQSALNGTQLGGLTSTIYKDHILRDVPNPVIPPAVQDQSRTVIDTVGDASSSASLSKPIQTAFAVSRTCGAPNVADSHIFSTDYIISHGSNVATSGSIMTLVESIDLHAALKDPALALVNVFKTHNLARTGYTFTLNVTPTQFHTGKLLVVYTPEEYEQTAGLAWCSSRNLPSAQLNMSGETTVSFDVPYIAATRLFHPTEASTGQLGYIKLYIYNTIHHASTASGSLGYNITMRLQDPYLGFRIVNQSCRNFVGALNTYVQNHPGSEVEFTYENSGPPHDPTFKCHLKFTDPSDSRPEYRILYSQGIGNNKASSKQMACRLMLIVLKSPLGGEDDCLAEHYVNSCDLEDQSIRAGDGDEISAMAQESVSEPSQDSWLRPIQNIREYLARPDICACLNANTIATTKIARCLKAPAILGVQQRATQAIYAYRSGSVNFNIASGISRAHNVLYGFVSQPNSHHFTTSATFDWTRESTSVPANSSLSDLDYTLLNQGNVLFWQPGAEPTKDINVKQYSLTPVLRNFEGDDAPDRYQVAQQCILFIQSYVDGLAMNAPVLVTSTAGSDYNFYFPTFAPMAQINVTAPTTVITPQVVPAAFLQDQSRPNTPTPPDYLEPPPFPRGEGDEPISYDIPPALDTLHCCDLCSDRSPSSGVSCFNCDSVLSHALNNGRRSSDPGPSSPQKSLETFLAIRHLVLWRYVVGLHHLSRFLAICGDVESNPGPGASSKPQSGSRFARGVAAQSLPGMATSLDFSKILNSLFSKMAGAIGSSVSGIGNCMEFLRQTSRKVFDKIVEGIYGRIASHVQEEMFQKFGHALVMVIDLCKAFLILGWVARKIQLFFRGAITLVDVLSDFIMLYSTDLKGATTHISNLFIQVADYAGITRDQAAVPVEHSSIIAALGTASAGVLFSTIGLGISPYKSGILNIISNRILGESARSFFGVVKDVFKCVLDYFFNGESKETKDTAKSKLESYTHLVPQLISDFYAFRSDGGFLLNTITNVPKTLSPTNPLNFLIRSMNVIKDIRPSLALCNNAIWSRWCSDVEAVWANLRKHVSSTVPRAEPVGIYFYGLAGTGKSHLASTIIPEIVLGKLGFTTKRSQTSMNVYNMPNNPDQQYMDNYSGQPYALLDDAGMTAEAKDFSQFINLISSASAPLNMASLDDKGALFISPFVALTTNREQIESVNIIQDKVAFARRFPIAVKVAVAPAYRKNATAGDNKLDFVKMTSDLQSCHTPEEELALYDRVFQINRHDMLQGNQGSLISVTTLITDIVNLYILRCASSSANVNARMALEHEPVQNAVHSFPQVDTEEYLNAYDILREHNSKRERELYLNDLSDGITSEHQAVLNTTPFAQHRVQIHPGPTCVPEEQLQVQSKSDGAWESCIDFDEEGEPSTSALKHHNAFYADYRAKLEDLTSGLKIKPVKFDAGFQTVSSSTSEDELPPVECNIRFINKHQSETLNCTNLAHELAVILDTVDNKIQLRAEAFTLLQTISSMDEKPILATFKAHFQPEDGLACPFYLDALNRCEDHIVRAHVAVGIICRLIGTWGTFKAKAVDLQLHDHIKTRHNCHYICPGDSLTHPTCDPILVAQVHWINNEWSNSPYRSPLKNVAWRGITRLRAAHYVGKTTVWKWIKPLILSLAFIAGVAGLGTLIMKGIGAIIDLIWNFFFPQDQSYSMDSRKQAPRNSVPKPIASNLIQTQGEPGNQKVQHNCYPIYFGVGQEPTSYALALDDRHIVLNYHTLHDAIHTNGGELYIATRDSHGELDNHMKFTCDRYVQVQHFQPGYHKNIDAVVVRLSFVLPYTRSVKKMFFTNGQYQDFSEGLTRTAAIMRSYTTLQSDLIAVLDDIQIKVPAPNHWHKKSSTDHTIYQASRTMEPTHVGVCGTPLMKDHFILGIHTNYNVGAKLAGTAVLTINNLSDALGKIAELHGEVVSVDYTPPQGDLDEFPEWIVQEQGYPCIGHVAGEDGKKVQVHPPNKTDFVHSHLRDTTQWPDDSAPILPTVGLLIKRSQKYEFKQPANAPSQPEEEFAFNYWNSCLTQFPDRPTAILTDDEVMNGTEDGLVLPLKRNSSAGFWSAISSQKKDILDQVTHPDGHVTFKLSAKSQTAVHPSLGLSFQAYLDKKEASFRRAERMTDSFTTACLKDELRPLDKVAIKKNRVFENPPLDTTWLTKAYFGSFATFIRSHGGPIFGHAIGLDKEQYGKILHDHLTSNGKTHGIAIDYSGWDGSVPPAAFAFFLRVSELYYHDATPEERNVRATLIHELQFTPIIVKDRVCLTQKGNKSGTWLTDFFNSFVNLWAWLVAFHRTMSQECGQAPILENWTDNITYFSLGDDVIMTAADSYLVWFNGDTIGKVLVDLGFFATGADKEELKKEPLPLQELSFLKSVFTPHPTGVVFTPMPKTVSYRELNWVRKSVKDNVTIRKDQIEDSLRFMAHHGKEAYDTHARSILERIHREPGLSLSPPEIKPWNYHLHRIWALQANTEMADTFASHTYRSYVTRMQNDFTTRAQYALESAHTPFHDSPIYDPKFA